MERIKGVIALVINSLKVSLLAANHKGAAQARFRSLEVVDNICVRYECEISEGFLLARDEGTISAKLFFVLESRRGV
jgi:hypothetical protein